MLLRVHNYEFNSVIEESIVELDISQYEIQN